MLPFDFCCSSVKKELRKRTCKICNQYIPSAYRMKNHYKIHAQLYEDFDHDQDETGNSSQPATTNRITTNDEQTATAPPEFKTEMLDWLRTDFDHFDLGPDPNKLQSDRITRSMKKLCVKEEALEEGAEEVNQDWVFVE